MVAMYGVGKTRGQSGVLKVPAATNQACAAILPSKNYNTLYLHQYLQLQYKALRELERGAQQTNLNLSIVKGFPLALPPLTLQTQFATFPEQVEAQKARMREGLELMELNYKALMQKCFEGGSG